MSVLRSVNLANPGVLISIIIALTLAVKMAVAGFPLIVDSLAELGGLDNFSFGTLFSGDSVMELAVSAVLLIGILAIIGIKMSGSKR